MADKLLLFKTLSERDNLPNDGSRLKNLFQSWKTGNYEPSTYGASGVNAVLKEHNAKLHATPESDGALSIVSVIDEIDKILP